MAAARTKNLPDVKFMPHFINDSNKDLPDVKLCHTVSMIQTKNLPAVKLCLDVSEWLLKTISFESLYRGLSPPYPKQNT